METLNKVELATFLFFYLVVSDVYRKTSVEKIKPTGAQRFDDTAIIIKPSAAFQKNNQCLNTFFKQL